MVGGVCGSEDLYAVRKFLVVEPRDDQLAR